MNKTIYRICNFTAKSSAPSYLTTARSFFNHAMNLINFVKYMKRFLRVNALLCIKRVKSCFTARLQHRSDSATRRPAYPIRVMFPLYAHLFPRSEREWYESHYFSETDIRMGPVANHNDFRGGNMVTIQNSFSHDLKRFSADNVRLPSARTAKQLNERADIRFVYFRRRQTSSGCVAM